MYDDIYRFSRELNGTFAPSITPANQIIKMPWSLKKIDSGFLNLSKLVNRLIQQILSIKPISQIAYTKVTIKIKSIAREKTPTM